jgi:hypothetical protein
VRTLAERHRLSFGGVRQKFREDAMMITTNPASVLVLVTNLVVASCTTMPSGVPSATTPTAAADTVPTLQILSPKNDDTITLPNAVRFAVRSFTVTKGGGQIMAFAQGAADGPVVALEFTNEEGLAYLPSNKFLTGKRDLTFALAKADGTLLENPEARVTVQRLTIQGRR